MRSNYHSKYQVREISDTNKISYPLLKCNNDKLFSGKDCVSLIKVAKDIIALPAPTNSKLTHQLSFVLGNNLDKTYQQLTKNVPPVLENMLGDDVPESIQNIKNINHLKQKVFKSFPKKPWKPLPERVPTTPKQQMLQLSTRQWLNTKGKIPVEQ